MNHRCADELESRENRTMIFHARQASWPPRRRMRIAFARVAPVTKSSLTCGDANIPPHHNARRMTHFAAADCGCGCGKQSHSINSRTSCVRGARALCEQRGARTLSTLRTYHIGRMHLHTWWCDERSLQVDDYERLVEWYLRTIKTVECVRVLRTD